MDSEIGLNQQLEFLKALQSKWPDINPVATQDFIAGLRQRELGELWWMYKEAFYTADKWNKNRPDKIMEDKLRQILIRYSLVN